MATIMVDEVEQRLAKIPGHASFSPATIERLKKEILTELVNRALVIEHLNREQFLANETVFEARWLRYMADQVGEEQTRKHFESHRREFDGTQLKVSHILLRIEPPEDATSVERALASATKLRARIAAGELTFAQAAREYSTGPSRDRDGELGWIGRQGPMVESFNRAAFKLEPSQMSEPVVSPFGVHLIHCLEVKPGRLRYEEVRSDVRQALSIELFHKVAEKVRPMVKVEYEATPRP
jgi:parvulin-like peptidyl-prolyl isomerase